MMLVIDPIFSAAASPSVRRRTGLPLRLSLTTRASRKGFNAYDKAEDQNTVNEDLNKLAQKLFYTTNDGRLAGTVKIAEGLTASCETLKTGNISFSTDATGTKTPGQGFYEYTVKDDSVITDPITGNLDKKYVNLGIETEKGMVITARTWALLNPVKVRLRLMPTERIWTYPTMF